MLGEAWGAASGLLLDTAYETFGVAVQWRPAAGGAYDLVAIPSDEDVRALFQDGPRRTKTKRVYKVRASEIEARAPGERPRAQDVLVVGQDVLTIINPPFREDSRQLEWTLDLA